MVDLPVPEDIEKIATLPGLANLSIILFSLTELNKDMIDVFPTESFSMRFMESELVIPLLLHLWVERK
ncbi:hypothetical protein ACB092_11G268500 [Castanea dentata]